MTSFDDREKAYESKFAHDEELKFKATARRDKRLGRWAAKKMGLTDGEVKAYAKSVVRANLAKPGDEEVFRKIRADFDEAKVDKSDHQIRRKMEQLMNKAVTKVEAKLEAKRN